MDEVKSKTEGNEDRGKKVRNEKCSKSRERQRGSEMKRQGTGENNISELKGRKGETNVIWTGKERAEGVKLKEDATRWRERRG